MHAPALLLLALACAPEDGPWARAAVIGDLDEAIGGPKAIARPGDVILENDRVRVAILTTRTSFGPHTSGASLVDADLQRDDPRTSHGHGNDRLAELFPTVNLNVQEADDEAGTVEIVADGSDGGPAIVCTSGPEQSFISMMDALWAATWDPIRPIFHMRTDYELAPGSGAVRIRTWAVFGDEAPCDADLEDAVPVEPSDDTLDVVGLALERGVVMGDFYMQGGSVDVFVPDVGFDEKSYLWGLQQAGVNTLSDPIRADFLAGAADGVSYALMAAEGSLFMPLFTSSQTVAVGGGVEGDPDAGSARFPDGTTLLYERWFGIGRGDVGSAVDALLEATGAEVGRVSGHVVEETTGVALSGVHVFAFRCREDGTCAEGPWTEWTTDVGDDPHPDGSFSGLLPVGDWELLVHAKGRPDGERVPITVTEEGLDGLVLVSPRPGSVHFTVVDDEGRPVPAKVTFFAADGDSPRNSDLGDGYVAGDPAAVAFAPHGEGEVVLPPGRYTAVASRGVEYELDEVGPFEIAPTDRVDLQLQVVRTVDTTGWIAADFHVHAQPSFDSGITLEDRVITMAAEGMEFFTSSDHDAITDYRPAIEELGLEEWVGSAPGLEVTTLELGHFLGFPLDQDPMADQGGAIDWTGMTPQEMFDGLRALGEPGGVEPVVFVGHPRDGILGYFDEYGLNPYADDGGGALVEGTLLGLTNPLLSADVFSTDFDALEVLNAKRFELVRTPLQSEVDAYAEDEDAVDAYTILERTMAEQEALEAGDDQFAWGVHGELDDWFTLLNLGYAYTALGNSDTHSKTTVEAGCPRNYVQVATDDPWGVTPEQVAEAVRAGRVVATYGPFLRVYAGGDPANGPGALVAGPTTLTIEVEAPSWMPVDRVELYENGTLVREWTDIGDGAGLRFSETVDLDPAEDAWYVVLAMGDGDLSPVFTPVEIPPIQLQDVVSGALADVGSLGSVLGEVIPVPRAFPVMPFAVANPVRVDADGDGAFTPPGLPPWLVEPVEPDTDAGG